MNYKQFSFYSSSKPVFLDTSCFIYTIEQNAKYELVTRLILNSISDKKVKGVTSIITLAEVLRKPLELDNLELVKIYHSILTQTQNIEMFELNTQVALTAAKISAKYKFKLPDSFQLAVAKETKCEYFITNDKELTKFKEIKVLVLDDLISK